MDPSATREFSPNAALDYRLRRGSTSLVTRKTGFDDFEYPLVLDFLEFALYSLKGFGVNYDRGRAATLAHHDWTLAKITDNLRGVSLKIGDCDLLDHSVP
jgi:hypothetical protein